MFSVSTPYMWLSGVLYIKLNKTIIHNINSLIK